MIPRDEHTTICHECHLKMVVGSLAESQKASCPRCGCVLIRIHRKAFERALVFSLTAMICLLFSHIFQFIRISAHGVERELLLPEISGYLFSQGEWILGFLVALVVVIIPIVFTLALTALALLIKLRRANHRAILLLRVIEVMRFLNMAEIFFLGVLISMIKVVSLADVHLGGGFGAYALFSVCLVLALLHVDKFHFANAIQAVSSGQMGEERLSWKQINASAISTSSSSSQGEPRE